MGPGNSRRLSVHAGLFETGAADYLQHVFEGNLPAIFREVSHVSGNRGDAVAAGFRYLFVN